MRMRHLGFTVLLVCLGLPLSAETVTITGRVLDPDGRSLAGCQVVAWTPDPGMLPVRADTWSGADGSFAVNVDIDGALPYAWVIAFKEGFAPDWAMLVEETEVELRLGADPVSCAGVVTDLDGNPVLTAASCKAVLSALSECNKTAEICRDKDGNPEADTELRDYEKVPLGEDIQEFFTMEVAPHVPDAWINTKVWDHKDSGVGKVGYDINFNRYFYRYEAPRPLEEIEADIRRVEQEIMEMLGEVTG